MIITMKWLNELKLKSHTCLPRGFHKIVVYCDYLYLQLVNHTTQILNKIYPLSMNLQATNTKLSMPKVTKTSLFLHKTVKNDYMVV